MRRWGRIWRPALAGVALLGARAPAERWQAAWATSMQPLEGAARVPDAWLLGGTVRQVVHLAAGGRRLRLRLSNLFGSEPLAIAGVHVARAGRASGSIELSSDRTVRFGADAGVSIPPGAEWVSDPVDLPIAGPVDLAVNLSFAAPPARQTGHLAAHATSFFGGGDRLGAATLAGAATAEHWIALSAVEVEGGPPRDVVVALGDSITDGSHSVTDANGRWPDIAGARLAAGSRRAPILLNAGIGGNRLLQDGVGPGGLARLDRDVFDRPGATGVILLEGINDLGTLTRAGPVGAAAHAAMVAGLIQGYRQVAARARARGLAVYAMTLLPFADAASYRPDAATLADRQAINQWMRRCGLFTGVIDADRIMRDPADPAHLRAADDSGDHLHPSPAGYRRLGEAVADTLSPRTRSGRR